MRRGMTTGGGGYLDQLVAFLEEVATMSAKEALDALAAFIAVRREVTGQLRPVLEVEGQATTLSALITAVASFVSRDPEGGKRGQAFVAAALDMVFEDVVTNRVNDPSRHGPGDVRTFQDDRIRLSAEVKQQQVTETDVLIFAQTLAAWPLPSGVYVALDPTQQPLPATMLNEKAIQLYGAGVQVLEGVAAVFAAVTAWGLRSQEDVLEHFPRRMLARLEELEASVGGRREWAAIFRDD